MKNRVRVLEYKVKKLEGIIDILTGNIETRIEAVVANVIGDKYEIEIMSEDERLANALEREISNNK